MLSCAVLSAAAAAVPLASAASIPFRPPAAVHWGLQRTYTNGARPRTGAPAARTAEDRLTNPRSALSKRQADDSNSTNALVTYRTPIGAGSGDDSYDLVLDTGSAVTWIGAPFASYRETDTSVPTGLNFSVTYGSGNSADGPLINDTLTLAPGVNPKQIPIGNTTFGAGDETDHYWEDGICGMAPAIASTTKVVGHPKKELIHPVEAAFEQGLIPEPTFAVYFAPANETQEYFPEDIPKDARNGVVTYGGVNGDLFEGDIKWSPRTKVNGTAARGWGLDLLDLQFDNKSVSTTVAAGIVDTGTTLVLLPTDLYKQYFAAIPNATVDPTGYVRFPNTSLQHVPDLGFKFEGGTFVLNKYAQLLPLWAYEELGYLSGDTGDFLYSWVGDFGANSGSGFDFIIGMKFLERWYSAYDIAGDRVGFAETRFTFPQEFPEKGLP